MLWMMNLFWSVMLISSVVNKLWGAREYKADWEEEVIVNTDDTEWEETEGAPRRRRRSSMEDVDLPQSGTNKNR
jgi:hypothetical protein